MAYGPLDVSQNEGVFVTLAEDEPSCYQEAMSLNDACDAEYSILTKYHTWELVERPINVNVVRSRWTFQVKQDNFLTNSRPG